MTDMATSPTRISAAETFRLRLSAVIWFVLGLGFLLGLPILIDAHILAVVGVAILALLLAFPAAWLVRRLFAGQRALRWLTSYLKAFVGLLFGITTLVATPLYYLAFRTELQPLTVPQATLSNGTKTVIFQGMMHVGSAGFYKSVIYDLEKALSEDYVIYYEGVMSDPEGDAWFNDTFAGGGDLSLNYETLGSACGLEFQQTYFQLLTPDIKAHPERHVSADVTTADMKREYERLVADDPEFAKSIQERKPIVENEDDANQVTAVFNWLAQATPGQRRILGLACRGWMTMLMTNSTKPSPMDPVVLDFRNRELAKRIESSSDDKIFMTYGAEHLHGLLDLLQADDPAWEVKSVKWMRTIEMPEDLEGEL